jgi:uncharacterized protein YfeS
MALVQVEVDLYDIDDDDLIEEIERRNLNIATSDDIIKQVNNIADAICLGKKEIVNKLLEDMIWNVAGRIVEIK